jgi:hypothetical protein
VCVLFGAVDGTSQLDVGGLEMLWDAKSVSDTFW